MCLINDRRCNVARLSSSVARSRKYMSCGVREFPPMFIPVKSNFCGLRRFRWAERFGRVFAGLSTVLRGFLTLDFPRIALLRPCADATSGSRQSEMQVHKSTHQRRGFATTAMRSVRGIIAPTLSFWSLPAYVWDDRQ